MKPKITTLLPTCFWITAMHSVCCCSLPVWRRSSLKKGTPMTYFGPALDPPLDGSGRKTSTLVKDLEYFIHTKFHQNLSSGSGEEVKNVNCLTDDGRQTDGRTTDAEQRVITIGHWSLWLLCPKNCYDKSVNGRITGHKSIWKFPYLEMFFPMNFFWWSYSGITLERF